MINFEKIWQLNTDQFALSSMSLHGPVHWRQVESNALQLAAGNGANETLVRLFAVYHDAKRENEGYDPQHGYRAADLMLEHLEQNVFTLDDADVQTLVTALQLHNDGKTSDDLVIGTCWDADRMDLRRVAIKIDAKYMSTKLGKAFANVGAKAFED